MAPDGSVRDTTLTALRHGLVHRSADEFVVGVVCHPPSALRAVVDECEPALAPPAEVLETFERRCEAFKRGGLCDEGAHNAAWEDVGVDDRYRDLLETDPGASDALDRLRDRLEAGQSLLLVGDEPSENRRSHRTILRERLERVE
ncbi:hypothetical protein SAMN04487948_10240 [Halogranum amylolyticum]|uniref:Uncharacterized protein n=1 Tax=Halogranum amylolyticum TaxID=660520 RepID=A0A1H8P2B3_9EURY|nr:hypothetical protein [Halogranum amylolyticum]SEO35693.1 hypothetical protein SAMN04487948_10240 [Halogranum amylolyticum]